VGSIRNITGKRAKNERNCNCNPLKNVHSSDCIAGAP
jgi:hypothetical protein